MSALLRLRDLWLFQRRTQTGELEVTAGTIVYGALVRAVLVILGSLAVVGMFPDVWQHWWLILLVLWGVVFYPAYRRWSAFTEEVRQLRQELLCGSCRHFDETAQVCLLLDEHVRPDYIPCGGESWEPLNEWDREPTA